jgi:hypothetical protein
MTMTTDVKIDIFKVLDFIRDHASEYAQAKADRVHLEEFRKSKKALLMRQAEIDGHKSAVAQEREAYAHPEYLEVLEGLKAAVEKEESLRWLITAAQAKFSAWQTLEATRRIEAKII